VAETPVAGGRVSPELVDAARREARKYVGQQDLPLSVLVRAGLAMLAGVAIGDALRNARTRPGPKPRGGAAA
jgi:hypothetical protein